MFLNVCSQQLPHFLTHHIIRKFSTDLHLVGKLQQVLTSQHGYPSGQTFLHKTLGYRGVILFGCKIPFFDRSRDEKTSSKQGSNPLAFKPFHGLKKDPSKHSSVTSMGTQPDLRMIYQVLSNGVDTKDYSNSENLTYLHVNNTPLVLVEGIDYVSHDDVIPYENMDPDPFSHFLFNSLLSVTNSGYSAKDLLHAWKRRNERWLKNSSVHRQLTHGVRITVTPYYIGYENSYRGQKGFHYWRYTIRIENFNVFNVQLRERNWKILSSMGALETVKGRGVVGEEPILDNSNPVFQYNSSTSLQSKSGFMFGTFKFERVDGKMFDVIIPPFPLEVPSSND